MTDKNAKDVKILVNMTSELKEEVETYQFENRIPSRNEAIRVLIKKGLDQDKEPTK